MPARPGGRFAWVSSARSRSTSSPGVVWARTYSLIAGSMNAMTLILEGAVALDPQPVGVAGARLVGFGGALQPGQPVGADAAVQPVPGGERVVDGRDDQPVD